ncbi:acyl carrier protein [Candidatus Omnitrophota bacterium]
MQEEVCRVIEKALDMKAGSISVDDDVEWDSLGFLAILSALESRFGDKVAKIDDLASVKSVREIVDIFKREHII